MIELIVQHFDFIVNIHLLFFIIEALFFNPPLFRNDVSYQILIYVLLQT